jgi:hypothetical protein
VPAVQQDGAIGVPVRIDETWGDDPTTDIDHVRGPARFHGRKVADREDPVAQDPDIRALSRRARAVDDGAPTQDQVERGHDADDATTRASRDDGDDVTTRSTIERLTRIRRGVHLSFETVGPPIAKVPKGLTR